MRYGRGACPKGFLPVFSCDSEEEAQALIVATCSLGEDGNYYSAALAAHQSLEVLAAFSDKLAKFYPLIVKCMARR